jgi:hypothetical protein
VSVAQKPLFHEEVHHYAPDCSDVRARHLRGTPAAAAAADALMALMALLPLPLIPLKTLMPPPSSLSPPGFQSLNCGEPHL